MGADLNTDNEGPTPSPSTFAEMAPEYERAISTTRKEFAARQHAMGFLERRRFRPRPPLWLRMAGGGLRGIYADVGLLREHGEVVWGYIVQANEQLFDPMDKLDCPAAVIYSLDSHYFANLRELEQMAVGLFGVKGDNVNDPEMQRFGELLADEREIQMKLPLPGCLTGPREVFYTSIMVHREQLPFPFLATSAFPLLVAPAQTTATMILPIAYWSKEMVSYWVAVVQSLLEEE